MASKVRVSAKSQKWAALGIIDAYIKTILRYFLTKFL